MAPTDRIAYYNVTKAAVIFRFEEKRLAGTSTRMHIVRV